MGKQNRSNGFKNTKNRNKPSPSQVAPHVRLMAPFAMVCDQCSNAVYKSTKFNARKRQTSKTYLGIKIINFEITCPKCSNKICFETDPKTSSYIVVSGGHRLLDTTKRDKAAEQETDEERIRRLGTVEKEDKLEKMATTADENLKQAGRDQEVDELQRLVAARMARRR